MDDIVDLEIEKLDAIISKVENDPEPEDIKSVELNLWRRIKEKAIQGRRTGLGITAEGDMLAALGVRYGTEPATLISEEIHKQMAISSYRSSIQMAKERGAFPIWSWENEKGGFIDRMSDVIGDEWLKDWAQYGRRNIANLTIAPAGSVSILTQTTSGIEPCFMPFYKRRRKTDDKAKCVFKDDVGDMWEEYNVFHHKFKDWYRIANIGLTGIDGRDIEELSADELDEVYKLSPYYKATANDVEWVAKVDMQGRVQKWVDHSISCTHNLPKGTPVYVVDQLYRKAWESGCKGATVYVDGSRDGVLITENSNKSTFSYSDAFPRPETIKCDIYHKVALKKNWTIIVGLIDNKPYEIFAIEDSDMPKSVKRGEITRVKKRHYKLDAGNFIVDNIVKLMSDDERTNTRKFSQKLRHRISPQHIINQIEKYAIVTSFDKVIQRVLRNYVEPQKEACPECGDELIYEGGCCSCRCGWSKCS